VALLRSAGLGLAARGLLGWASLLALGACHLVFDGDLGVVRCARDGTYGPPSCPVGETCVAGVCSPVGAPLGAPCALDEDCEAPSFCLDPVEFGFEGAPRCTRSCCSAGECGRPDQGLVCWVPSGSVGAVCWPHEPIGRALPGDTPRGQPCDDDEDCRSGRCGDEGRCFDTCCSDAGCDGLDVCRAGAAPERDGPGTDAGRVWQCGKPPTAGDVDQGCVADQNCRNNLCGLTAVPPDVEEEICIRPCCSSRECGEVEVMDEMFPLACSISGDGVRGCSLAMPPSAKSEVGAPCDGDDACRSGLCVPSDDGDYCSDLCCKDESCGDVSIFACRPGEVRGTWALRCVRR